MKSLSKLQIDHLMRRVHQINDQLMEQEIKTSLPPRPEYQDELRFEDKYKLISAGKAKLRPVGELNRNTDLEDAYIYPVYAAIKTKKEINVAAWYKKSNAIEARYAREIQIMQDKIILGDSITAMNMLVTLEARLNP